MEFPAVGWRDTSSGALYGAGVGGYYWSSVAYDSDFAHYLWFVSSNLTVYYNLNKQFGFSVRCVR